MTTAPQRPPGVAEALQPFRRDGLELSNRFMFMATINFLGAANNDITPEKVAFYAARAQGGIGAIVTEGLSVHRTSIPNQHVPLAYDRESLPKFAKLADAIHRTETKLFGQLWHVGRNALWNPGMVPWSASGERDPYSGSTPHEMTEPQIEEVIAGYVASARNLQDAGFDGVELHGAHGYLITQFLSPWSNRRDDRWGGSLENRCRLVVELIKQIRAQVRPDFVVGLKLSAHEYVPGGLDLPASQEIVAHIVERAAPDYIGVSQSNFSPSLEYHTPDMRFDDAPFAYLARGIKAVSGGVPVMAMAKVPSVAAGAELIARGDADLIGMSRPLVADAALIAKTKAGDQPRPCIFCNYCWHAVVTHRPIICVYGPETGQEKALAAAPAQQAAPRRVRVVGAGPAGLEFARTASSLGHEVHLYDRDDRVGGRLLAESRIPGHESVAQAVDWLRDQAAAAGTAIHAGIDVTPDMIGEWSQDVVVQATGAEPVVDPLPGTTPVDLMTALHLETLEEPVVIIDELEDDAVLAVAEAIARRGLHTVLVTRRDAFGRRVPYVNLIGALRRLADLRVDTYPLRVPVRVEDGTLIARHSFGTREEPLCKAGTVVRGGPYRAAPKLTGAGREVITIGDASSPRDVGALTREAHQAATELGRASKEADKE